MGTIVTNKNYSVHSLLSLIPVSTNPKIKLHKKSKVKSVTYFPQNKNCESHYTFHTTSTVEVIIRFPQIEHDESHT